jgi:hypothetical protein
VILAIPDNEEFQDAIEAVDEWAEVNEDQLPWEDSFPKAIMEQPIDWGEDPEGDEICLEFRKGEIQLIAVDDAGVTS